MAKSSKLTDALNRLAAAEEHFLNVEFLAPAMPRESVQVRIAGVICSLQISPRDFEGWGVFRPTTHSEAKLVRRAKLAERQRYLELFPLVRLILAASRDNGWHGLPAHRADSRFRIEGLVPIRLVEDAQLFEAVETRFDGANFWYAGPDARWDPGHAAYLRDELDRLTPPEQIERSGLSAEERDAYAINYWPRYELTEEARRGREERRLRSALDHAGATFRGYVERADSYTITFDVDGQRHVSSVAKSDLSVQVAGICLSGEDENFDLQSLVGVIREGQGDHGLVRVGQQNQGMPEEQYWQVHPRR